MYDLWVVVIIAYALDHILGDPAWLPHPVRGIGWCIERLESILRKIIPNERIGGVIMVLSIVSLVGGGTILLSRLVFNISPYLGLAFQVIILYTTFATKDLSCESMNVHKDLNISNIDGARSNLSKIVGRDTNDLNESEIARAAVETVAESSVDGIIAPLFYAFIGGAPLALTYKAINTLDSMVGYKNERYKNFGWASAKLDDIFNFIPARIAGLLMPLAAVISGQDGLSSFKIVLRDRKKHPSPNSGIPEAAVAGALNIQLGGKNSYGGVEYTKPLIGDKVHSIVPGHIKDSLRISLVSSVLTVISGVILSIFY